MVFKIECAENSFLYECLNWFAFFHAFVIDDADGNVCKSQGSTIYLKNYYLLSLVLIKSPVKQLDCLLLFLFGSYPLFQMNFDNYTWLGKIKMSDRLISQHQSPEISLTFCRTCFFLSPLFSTLLLTPSMQPIIRKGRWWFIRNWTKMISVYIVHLFYRSIWLLLRHVFIILIYYVIVMLFFLTTFSWSYINAV